MYGLRELAQAKFVRAQHICWDKESLVDVVEKLYSEFWVDGCSLRGCLFSTIISHYHGLRARPAFMNLVQTYPEFATDLLDAWSTADTWERSVYQEPPKKSLYGGSIDREWSCDTCKFSGLSKHVRCPSCRGEVSLFGQGYARLWEKDEFCP